VNNSSYYLLEDKLDILQASFGDAVILEQRGRFVPFLSSRYLNDIEVRLQTSMLLSKSGSLGSRPDYRTSDAISDDRLTAIASEVMAKRKSSAPPPPAQFSFEMKFPKAGSAPEPPLSREMRLVGLFKLWTVLSYFAPNLEYASMNRATMLREWIPEVEAAENVRDYARVLRRLAAQLNDSHVRITNPPSNRPSSPNQTRSAPFRLRPVEGKPVVVEISEKVSAEAMPLHIGDEILAVNGRNVDEIMAADRTLISASTPGALLRNLVYGVEAATAEKETAEVTVRNASGRHTVTVKTITSASPAPLNPYRILDSGFAYINLDQLTEQALDAALTKIAPTKGLILDMRGYPQFFIQRRLVPYLMDKAVHTPIYQIPLVSKPADLGLVSTESFEWVEPHPSRRYLNPIVVLIDDRAQSAAEGFCMFMRNAHRATFVGSTTAGTNGNVTSMSLPGGLRMVFTGMQVKFADGTRFQNIGIVPDVKVEPTIEGVRAGRDEILETGVETLKAMVSRIAKKETPRD
jgi:C-terminal processing protease CtpA/Prc